MCTFCCGTTPRADASLLCTQRRIRPPCVLVCAAAHDAMHTLIACARGAMRMPAAAHGPAWRRQPSRVPLDLIKRLSPYSGRVDGKKTRVRHSPHSGATAASGSAACGLEAQSIIPVEAPQCGLGPDSHGSEWRRPGPRTGGHRPAREPPTPDQMVSLPRNAVPPSGAPGSARATEQGSCRCQHRAGSGATRFTPLRTSRRARRAHGGPAGDAAEQGLRSDVADVYGCL